jgi:HD-like signal output (HDOD) protein
VKRVLFVDDEPNILDGLRNVLRKQRSVWAMEFVSSGEAALERMAREPADVVVSDMRMPGMDGAQLLKRIRASHPAAARIVLTGHASKEDLLEVLPIAQQVLSKPCDPQMLVQAVERMCRLQSLLSNPRLQALVGGLEHLPTFPKCHQQLAATMQRDDATVAQIAQIVERDPALSAKTLSMANSAYFGLARPTTSIPVAVRHVGFTLLRALALSTDLFGSIDASLLTVRTLHDLPHRALLRAQLATKFVLDRSLTEEAFTAALMLDIGILVLVQRQREGYMPLLARTDGSTLGLSELEQQSLGFTHAEVGAYLLDSWGLPTRLVEVVASHHAPALLEVATNPVAIAVHVADVLTDPAQAAGSDPTAGIAPTILERAEVRTNLADWQTMALQAMEST